MKKKKYNAESVEALLERMQRERILNRIENACDLPQGDLQRMIMEGLDDDCRQADALHVQQKQQMGQYVRIAAIVVIVVTTILNIFHRDTVFLTNGDLDRNETGVQINQLIS